MIVSSFAVITIDGVEAIYVEVPLENLELLKYVYSCIPGHSCKVVEPTYLVTYKGRSVEIQHYPWEAIK